MHSQYYHGVITQHSLCLSVPVSHDQPRSSSRSQRKADHTLSPSSDANPSQKVRRQFVCPPEMPCAAPSELFLRQRSRRNSSGHRRDPSHCHQLCLELGGRSQLGNLSELSVQVREGNLRNKGQTPIIHATIARQLKPAVYQYALSLPALYKSPVCNWHLLTRK